MALALNSNRFHMSAPSSSVDRRPVSTVAIIGNDAVLAATPATPVQLAHACLRRGFTIAVPVSWGDELIASETVRRLAARDRGPAVMCVCPFVRSRLLAPGPDLAPFLVSLVSPPVATARYVRAAYGDHGVHITYIGGCPGANDPAIDERLTPDAFLADLAEHGIALSEQPLVFDSIVPPDRRRWCSLPGGTPTAEMLWTDGDTRALVEIDRDDVSTDLAQHIIAQEHVLLDLAPALGCACSGAIGTIPARNARSAVTAVEPPRALGPVVDPPPTLSLSIPVAGVSGTDGASGVAEVAERASLGDATAAMTAPSPSDYSTDTATNRGERDEVTTADSVAPSAAIGADSDLEESCTDASVIDANRADAGTADTPIAEASDESPFSAEVPVDLSVGETAADLRPGAHGTERAATEVIVTTYAARDEVIREAVLTIEPELADRVSPIQSTERSRAAHGFASSRVRRRTPMPMPARQPGTSIPKALSSDGRALPRAYVAKRRTPPGGAPSIVEEPDGRADALQAAAASDTPVAEPEFSAPVASDTVVTHDPAPAAADPEQPVAIESKNQPLAAPQDTGAPAPEPPPRQSGDQSPHSNSSTTARAAAGSDHNPSAIIVLVVALIALGFFVFRSLG